MEHIGEADTLVRFPCVIAEHRLVDISLEIPCRNEMVDTEDGTLKLAPKALNAVGVRIPDNELPCIVADNGMGVFTLVQGIVADILIRIDTRAFLHELTDERTQRVSLRVPDLSCHQLTASLNHAEHGCLCLGGTALISLGLLALVLVLFTTTDICLVAFHLSAQFLGILRIERAYLLQHEPCRLLRYLAVPCNLMGGNTLLVGGN